MSLPKPRVKPRVFLIVLDSVGIGALPDAADYGDAGTNTLAHVAAATGGLHLPTLASLGLGNIMPLAGVAPAKVPAAAWGKLAQHSVGKDTTVGHWELAGLVTTQAFPTYPQGFGRDLMQRFQELTGYGWLGGMPASGTAIINELGQRHLDTGYPLVYTSADSVFQIAAHSARITTAELYRICEISRNQVLVGRDAVARVIARPFTGDAQHGFTRTAHRRDYALAPPAPTLPDHLSSAGIPVTGVGKISDIFAGRGIGNSLHTSSNAAGMDALTALLDTQPEGLIWANLVDFDMLWGHRRDPQSYGQGLEAFDAWLAGFLPRLAPTDLLIITADHGCDPTHSGSDHTREYVPLLVRGDRRGNRSVPTGCIRGAYMTEVATMIAAYFGLNFTYGRGPATGPADGAQEQKRER